MIPAPLVVDASAILSLAFEDEDRACGFRILDAAEADRNLIVPAVWPLEVGNGLVVAERKGRLKPDALMKFISLLKGLAVSVDQRSFAYTMETILPLSRKYNLTVYDAAYLDLAIREGAELASLDGRLCEACKAAGGRVL